MSVTWSNVQVTLGELKPWADNPRLSSKRQAQRLLDSWRQFGQVQTVAIGPANEVYDGHQRLSALLTVHGPSYQVDARRCSRELSDVERRALVVTLHAGAVGSWNWDNLANWDAGELQEWGFDSETLTTWQRDVGALGNLIGSEEADSADAEPQIDRAAELNEKWQVKPGDLWRIGEHRLACGDCREPKTWERLLAGAKANGVFTSPPYAEQRKEQYGGVPTTEYVEWWEAVQANVKANLAADGSFFVNIKPHSDDGERSLYVVDLVVAMSRQWYWSYVDEFCWLRAGVPREVMYSFKNGFEPIYHFAANRKRFKFRPVAVSHHSDSVPVAGGPGIGNTNWASKQGQPKTYGAAFGRTMQGVPGAGNRIFGTQKIQSGSAYPSNVLPAFSNDEALSHAAAFPVALPDFFIRAYSDVGDTWVDPFVGSGTTIVAAHNNKRIGMGIEQKPEYCAVVLERMATAFPGIEIERVA